ncbi:winged helix-turn-helix transcriptional regulator [Saccharothrix texasensis]|uniref:HxlR family transcriptional regulator n=1 Tax=Saccharothrix texasensis TaxID=103734 RepID=A0A3N1H977_9PSEU|nr:helix-turn-helix domain-containing protein [Saccharothrix texasensis]ROP39028.1 HxlR family transcriptional regulator [Saccharothrix texasensis]
MTNQTVRTVPHPEPVEAAATTSAAATARDTTAHDATTSADATALAAGDPLDAAQAADASVMACAPSSAWAGDPHGEVDHPVPDCPVEITLRALRGRWTTLVVRELFAGERAFGDLAAALPALSDKVLGDRLAQLVACGVVVRVREPGWPSRVRYSLTGRGRALRGVLDAMWAWGADVRQVAGAE